MTQTGATALHGNVVKASRRGGKVYVGRSSSKELHTPLGPMGRRVGQPLDRWPAIRKERPQQRRQAGAAPPIGLARRYAHRLKGKHQVPVSEQHEELPLHRMAAGRGDAQGCVQGVAPPYRRRDTAHQPCRGIRGDRPTGRCCRKDLPQEINGAVRASRIWHSRRHGWWWLSRQWARL